MDMMLKKGMKIQRGDLKCELRRIRLHKTNTVQFLAILERAGYIEFKGSKMIKIKKDLRLI